MAKYRKKPVVIEANQWFSHGDHPIVDYFNKGQAPCQYCRASQALHGWVKTLECDHIVCPGDWIITGVNGEHYPCKPDIFEKTYEVIC